MPTLTVIFVRSGESVDEDEAVGSSKTNLRRHVRVDPPLTPRGYRQAQDVFTALIQGICDQTPAPARRGDGNGDGVIDPLRYMALFSAPLRACQGTAVMLSAAGLAAQDKLTWRYTTVEAATNPSAVPVIAVNELCANQAEIIQCGGVATVVDAGLLHAAAAPWNDARVKCPFMQVCVKDMKGTAAEFVKPWKEDRTASPPNRVLEVQYLRLTDANDPWSLAELTDKVNLCIDMLPVNKYLTPPRKGNIECKLQQSSTFSTKEAAADSARAMVVDAVSDCVWKSRQVGCDTILFTVPASVLQCMMEQQSGGGTTPCATASPCAVLTMTADINNEDNRVLGGKIQWKLVGSWSASQIVSNPTSAVPLFEERVFCIVPPPKGKDPASVPANQWSAFPPPEPEVIPDDYPDLYVLLLVCDCGCTCTIPSV